MQYKLLIGLLVLFQLFWNISAKNAEIRVEQTVQSLQETIGARRLAVVFVLNDSTFSEEDTSRIITHFETQAPRLLQYFVDHDTAAIERFFAEVLEYGLQHQISRTQEEGLITITVSLCRLGHLPENRDPPMRIGIYSTHADMSAEEKQAFSDRYRIVNQNIANAMATENYQEIERLYAGIARDGYVITRLIESRPNGNLMKIILTRREGVSDGFNDLIKSGVFRIVDPVNVALRPQYQLKTLFMTNDSAFTQEELIHISGTFEAEAVRLINLILELDEEGIKQFYVDINNQGMGYTIVVEIVENVYSVIHFLHKLESSESEIETAPVAAELSAE